MALVVFFLCFNCALIAAYLHHRRRQRRNPDAPAPRRMSGAQLRAFGWRQVFLAAMLVYTYVHGDWTAASVGIHSPHLWLESILAGEVAFLALMLGYMLLLRVTGLMQVMRLAATRGNLTVWPRRRSHKVFAVVFIMGFNPFTEELVMRGILVHHWGLLLGSAVIPIVVGLVLNGLLHWYQGWRMQPWHAMYFATAVALLYSPWGLAAAITAHVLGDVLPFVHLRRNLLRARAVARATRASRALQAP
jgi:hypothetical protein